MIYKKTIDYKKLLKVRTGKETLREYLVHEFISELASDGIIRYKSSVVFSKDNIVIKIET